MPNEAPIIDYAVEPLECLLDDNSMATFKAWKKLYEDQLESNRPIIDPVVLKNLKANYPRALYEQLTSNQIDQQLAMAICAANSPPQRIKARTMKAQFKVVSNAIKGMDVYSKEVLADKLGQKVSHLLSGKCDTASRQVFALRATEIINALCEVALEESGKPTPRTNIDRDRAIIFIITLATGFKHLTGFSPSPANIAFTELVCIGLYALNYPDDDPSRLIKDALDV